MMTISIHRTRETVIAEVMSRGHIWDAHDQGRLAFHDGIPMAANPWRHPVLPWHINLSDWDRGWIAESDAKSGYPLAA